MALATSQTNSTCSVSPPLGIRIDRNELSGAFGDIGTDLPLLIGMVAAAGLDAASVLSLFGLMQVMTALAYRLPMPVQPLKAVAVIVITQKTSAQIIYGGGLAIGLLMLLLTLSGLIDWLARVVPKLVVRGIQLGLGLQLTTLALKSYVLADGLAGHLLAGIGFAITLWLLGNRRFPPAPFLIALGVVYSFAWKLEASQITGSLGFQWPQFHGPSWPDMAAGFLLLALPQVPLSIGNSILAAQQTARDLFPERPLTLRKISLTYCAMNLINPFFGGVPTCHGSGGLAGHYAFGARTGGSVLIYGAFYLALGLFCSRGFQHVVQIFPLPILGVILLFEGLTLMLLIGDVAGDKRDFFVVLLIGLIANGLPYGYLVALIVGTLVAYLLPNHPAATSR